MRRYWGVACVMAFRTVGERRSLQFITTKAVYLHFCDSKNFTVYSTTSLVHRTNFTAHSATSPSLREDFLLLIAAVRAAKSACTAIAAAGASMLPLLLFSYFIYDYSDEQKSYHRADYCCKNYRIHDYTSAACLLSELTVSAAE